MMNGENVENPLRKGLELRDAGPCTVVIFGASGDLTRRKLFPALYNLARDGLLHPDTSVVGLARREWSDEDFRREMRKGVDTYSRSQPVEEEVWNAIAGDISYVQGEFGDRKAYEALGERLLEVEGKRGEPGCRLFYLATPPSAYETILGNLKASNVVRGRKEAGEGRVVVEKPFGRDRESARRLNQVLHRTFHEDQVYRIDHYLGKETVQNLLVFRLENGIFEPLWNRRYVDHVQITVAEAEGVGTRGGFYEEVGVARDMLQNHLLQLLTLVAMEPPVRFDAKAVRDEKVKVLEAIPLPGRGEVERSVVRGQYAAGMVGGVDAAGYREEKGVDPDSDTETYLAARLSVENWRWAGTPFYLRSGKRLPKRDSEITIVFKAAPHNFFTAQRGESPQPNLLRLRIQPLEGISLRIQSKSPGQAFHIDDVRMDFNYATSFGRESPEAYEHLLLDAIQGDPTLFAREDEVELSWKLVDRVVEAWKGDRSSRPHPYPAGAWGPAEADDLIEEDGRRWVRI
jgi:glucose-6-phosphate 1-dehydrogenase